MAKKLRKYTKLLLVKVTDQEKEKVQELALYSRQTVSEIIRKHINQDFDNYARARASEMQAEIFSQTNHNKLNTKSTSIQQQINMP